MSNLSKTENKVLAQQAREALAGRWGLAIGAVLIYYAVFIGFSFLPLLGTLVIYLIAGPMALGFCNFCLCVSRKKEAQISQLFDGFKRFGVTVGAYFLQLIFIFLWALLLIIPGIIAGLSYSMTFYVIADNDSIGPLEAIRKSKEIMRGNKWKLFCLGARFIGWALLCILTLGIGFLWLVPYISISYAKFYDDITKK